MKKGSVLFISRKWPPAIGGMESYSAALARSLAARYDMELLVLPGHADGSPPGIPAYLRFVLKAMACVALHARKYDHLVIGDLVLYPAALVSSVFARRQSRTVVLYGLDLVYQKREGLLPFVYGIFLKSFMLCQGIFSQKVAISKHTRLLAEQAGVRNVSVVLPSIPESGLVDCAPDMRDLPDAFTTGRRKILYFGRLVRRKGAVWFASEVLPRLPEDVDFVVVGSPTDPAYLQQLVLLPRVQYLGRQNNQTLASLIAHSDVVVMPNIESPDSGDAEGFGLVAVETASLGGILVASRLQGITDAVVDGETGTLVEPGNADEWTRSIFAVLQETSERKQTRRDLARSVSRAAYSEERLGHEFAGILEGKARAHE